VVLDPLEREIVNIDVKIQDLFTQEVKVVKRAPSVRNESLARSELSRRPNNKLVKSKSTLLNRNSKKSEDYTDEKFIDILNNTEPQPSPRNQGCLEFSLGISPKHKPVLKSENNDTITKSVSAKVFSDITQHSRFINLPEQSESDEDPQDLEVLDIPERKYIIDRFHNRIYSTSGKTTVIL